MAQFKIVHPVLPVRNVSEAVRFYTEKLGFRLSFKDAENDPKYAGIIRDNVELHIQWQAEEDLASVEKLALRFVIDNVDELFEEYQNKGVFHSGTDLRDTPWGTREFAFYDPDGNGLFFYRSL